MNLDDLNNTFITADTHFGHENIIKFCERPFKTVEEMDKVLIANWNKIIGPDDIVYHLGDFTLGEFDEAQKYFSQLNGKIMILANPWHHDKRWLPKNYLGPLAMEFYNMESIRHVTVIPPMVVLEMDGLQERPLAVTLCHYPLAVWDRKHYGSWHLYGHTHKSDNSGEFRLNVGVDCMNYYPINLGNVLTLMYEKGW